MNNKRLRVLTWHVHGNYLWYLSETNCDFVLPVGNSRTHGYGGRGNTFPFGSNVIDCPIHEIKHQQFDCILFQSRVHYEVDQHELLTEAQKRLPCVYLEHDPPWEDVTDQKHWFSSHNGLLVHVTHFNRWMWQCDHVATKVIEHGVKVPDDVRYTGHLARGITAMNHLARRGRKVGADIFAYAAERTPIDLVGMAAEESGGIGEIVPTQLPQFISRYRYFFSPIRYTSLGLAILEAMMIGLPIIGLNTCELASVIENGRTGWLETNVDRLIEHAVRLTDDQAEAARLGDAARQLALERFNIRRFANDWHKTLWEVAGDSFARGVSRSPQRAGDSHTGSANATIKSSDAHRQGVSL